MKYSRIQIAVLILLIMCLMLFIAYLNKKPLIPVAENQILVFTFQDCEYMKYKDSIIHKGNCTNSIHAYLSIPISTNLSNGINTFRTNL